MGYLSQTSFDNYMRAGDVAVIAICLIMVILLFTSYVSRTRSFRIFVSIICLLVAAALVNIIYHELLIRNNPEIYNLIYALRLFYNALLFDVFFLFTLYTTVVSGMEHKKSRNVAIISTVLLVAIVGGDVICLLKGVGFHISEDGSVAQRTNIFMIG